MKSIQFKIYIKNFYYKMIGLYLFKLVFKIQKLTKLEFKKK